MGIARPLLRPTESESWAIVLKKVLAVRSLMLESPGSKILAFSIRIPHE